MENTPLRINHGQFYHFLEKTARGIKSFGSAVSSWKLSDSSITEKREMTKCICLPPRIRYYTNWPGLVEDYRLGYPRYTALLSAYDSFFICRRFSKLRARLLLSKQDRLSMLQQRLDQIDQEEESPLFLGKSRCDANTDRITLLSDIESCLADYGMCRIKWLYLGADWK